MTRRVPARRDRGKKVAVAEAMQIFIFYCRLMSSMPGVCAPITGSR